MVGKRRDKLEIIEDLLRIADNPLGANKTTLVYQSNLNFTRLENFLPFLIEKGLLDNVEDNESKFITTAKGRLFLKQLKSMQLML